MKDQSKTKQMLIEELVSLRQRISELERSESGRKRVDEQILVANERLQYLLSSTSAVIYAAKPSGDYGATFISDNVVRMAGYNPEEFIRDSNFWFDHIHPEDQPIISVEVPKIFEKEIHAYEYRFRCKDSRYIWVSDQIKLFRDNNGNPIEIIGFWTDITERKRAEEALQESEERYRNLFETANEAIFVAQDGKLVFLNPMTAMMIGYSREEAAAKSFTEFIHPDDRDMVIDRHVRRMKGDEPPNIYSFRIIHRDGNVKWVELNTVLMNWEGKPATLNFISDITERKQTEDALRESENRYRDLSIVDDLTQLYNSRHFYHQLKMEIERADRYGQPLTLLLLDLDDFKQFNDAYGHIEGDKVLLRLGQVVKRCLRQTDSAYRYGGEEFTVLLPMTTGRNCVVTAERIRMEFKKEIFSPGPGQDVHVTVSIGLAQYKPQEDMKAFVHRVDQLMYLGKKNGKDRVCCES